VEAELVWALGVEDFGVGGLFGDDEVFVAALWARKATNRFARNGRLVGIVPYVHFAGPTPDWTPNFLRECMNRFVIG